MPPTSKAVSQEAQSRDMHAAEEGRVCPAQHAARGRRICQAQIPRDSCPARPSRPSDVFVCVTVMSDEQALGSSYLFN
jgi:hypothetical protein